MKLTHLETTWLNDFATRGFRDIADHDYIAARQLYRSKLYIPFLWSAQQAIEKYLKAILLFNAVPVLDIGHDIDLALCDVKKIERLKFSIPPECEKFISYLQTQGPNRYFEIESHIPFGTLFELDKTVWYLRRYCDYLDIEILTENNRRVPLFDHMVNKVNSVEYQKKPHSFRILGGVLEREIDSKSEAGRCLIWNNFYYGRRMRNLIRNFTDHSHDSTPTHIFHPDSLEFLRRYAKIETTPKKRRPRKV